MVSKRFQGFQGKALCSPIGFWGFSGVSEEFQEEMRDFKDKVIGIFGVHS